LLETILSVFDELPRDSELTPGFLDNCNWISPPNRDAAAVPELEPDSLWTRGFPSAKDCTEAACDHECKECGSILSSENAARRSDGVLICVVFELSANRNPLRSTIACVEAGIE
jgi:hypothetical protein